MLFDRSQAAKSIIMLLLVRLAAGFRVASTGAFWRPATSPATTKRTTRHVHYYNSLWLNKRNARPTSWGVILHSTDDDNSNNEQSNDTASSSSSSSSSSTTEPQDVWAAYRNPKNRDDQVISAISKQGGIKVTACTIRNIVNDLMIQHTMTEITSSAIGRTITCALLMSNGMQEEQTVQITLNSDGPLRGLVAIASGKGNVRGFVGSPMLGNMTLEEAVGKGAVQVVKNHPDWPRPYNGITAIRHGDIDRDIGLYLAESEQRSCALAAATVTKGILCTAAGGYLIEQLPDVTDEEIAKVEENLVTLVEKDGSDNLPTNLLLSGMSPLDITEIILDGLDMQPLQTIKPTAECDCTEERLFRALRLLPREEVEDILEKEEQIEARCHFCGKVYQIGPPEVRRKLDEWTGDPALDEDFEKNTES